jgi:transcriptional regulator with XRE-family HTH domain
MSIGVRVKKVRQAHQLTQKAFAGRLGVERSLITKIEGGRVPLTPLLRRVLCQEFAVREDWLLRGRGEPWEDRLTLLERRARELGLDLSALRRIPRREALEAPGVAEETPRYGLPAKEREWWLALWPQIKSRPERVRLLNELLALWGLPRYDERKKSPK